MTDHVDHNRKMAQMMRETADLIERGLLSEWSVNVEHGYDDRPDPRTHGCTMTMVSTGERTVTIVLRGNDFRCAGWAGFSEPARLIGANAED